MINSYAAKLEEETTWPRERVDFDYNARASVTPETFAGEMTRYRQLSELAHEKLAITPDVIYDKVSQQTLDIFGAGQGLRPVFIFIHGGYWRALSKLDSAFMANHLAANDIASVAIDYQLMPDVNLREITRQTRAAIAFIWHEGHKFGLDKNRIFVGGSSAGGHLTGMVLTKGWHDAFRVPKDVVKGAMPISGLFHLGPISNSFVNEWAQLKREDVDELSPILHLPDNDGCPIITAYGECEVAGFARQSHAFHNAWLQKGFSSTLVEIQERNHFDVVLELSKHSKLSQHLVEMIDATR